MSNNISFNVATEARPDDLKGKTIRGGFISVCSQAVKIIFRTGSLVLLARLLVPEDFGLVGMVTSVTGILDLIKNAGLSAIAIQRIKITEEQISNLFWLNLAIGTTLAFITLAIAPMITIFYHEPRLFWVTIASGAGFIFSGASAQHQAMLLRQMRYLTLSWVEIGSLLTGITVGLVMAVVGLGYWALVGMSVTMPVASAILVWHATGWIPGLPRKNTGIRSMMHFGGVITLNGLIVYLAYNIDKILLGRYWGAAALGIYGRAFSLIKEPTDQLNGAIGLVAFPALSRLQDDPDRLKKYFLKGYSLVLAMTLPITIWCSIFASDIISVLLGPKWKDTVVIFRVLAPMALAFALINPFGWLLFSTGHFVRSLKMGLVIASLLIFAYVIGLGYGPVGVAIGFSGMMILLTVPLIAWAKHGMQISSMDIWQALRCPSLSGVLATIFTIVVKFYCDKSLGPFSRLMTGTSVLAISYIFILFYVFSQKNMYVDLLKELRKGSSVVKNEQVVV